VVGDGLPEVFSASGGVLEHANLERELFDRFADAGLLEDSTPIVIEPLRRWNEAGLAVWRWSANFWTERLGGSWRA